MKTTKPAQPKIERGIKIPFARNGSNTYAVLEKMAVGDSILVPRLKALHWYLAGRAKGIKLTTRRISDTQARVWRVK